MKYASMPLVFALAAGVTLSGCSSALYEKGTWTPPPGDAITADWDVASAQCEGEAINKEASAEDKEAAQSGFQTAMQAGQELGNTGSDDAFAAGMVIGLAGGLLSAVATSSMDEEAKDAHFTQCMEGLGWNVSQ